MTALSNPLRMMKTLALKAANALPVSSNTLGSPRRMSRAAALNFSEARANYKTVQSSQQIEESLPLTIDEKIFFKYNDYLRRTAPEQFILTVEDGRVWGRNGAIITANDVFVSDLSLEFGPAKFDPKKHSIWRRLKLRKPVVVNGAVAVVASPGANVYAHWLCDILPRMLLLKRAGLLDRADKIVMSFGCLDWQMETLQRLGIDSRKIINTFDDTEFHLRADVLYVSSYPNEHGTANAWACEAVRNLYISPNQPSKKNRRLYVSRAKAVGRKLLNEDAVYSFLQSEYGFEKIFAEDYTTQEKARLFYDAECVIGPHGGGFTNLLFCAPGCKVVDIFPPGDFTTYFWILANANHLPYAYFFGEGERPTKKDDFVRRNADITVNLDQFGTLVSTLKLENQNK